MSNIRNNNIFQNTEFLLARSKEVQIFLQLLHYDGNLPNTQENLKVLHIGNHINPNDSFIKQLGLQIISIDVKDPADSLFELLKTQQESSFDLIVLFSFNVEKAECNAFNKQVSSLLKTNGSLMIGMSKEKYDANKTKLPSSTLFTPAKSSNYFSGVRSYVFQSTLFTPEKSSNYFSGVRSYIFQSNTNNRYVFILSPPKKKEKKEIMDITDYFNPDMFKL